jgi:two-component system alkaline phosphatase synthesis response regulator PhoP
MKRLILLIEDDAGIQKLLKEALPEKLFILETADTGRDGLDTAVERRPDLILLDWNLPGWNGLDVCKALRENHCTSHIPVIMLTGYAQTQRKIAAFDLGADDYITKPFHLDELIARIKAVLRRRSGPAPDEITRQAGIVLNLTSFSAMIDGKAVTLTRTELGLLHMLMKNAGQVLTRKHLLERIWGYTSNISTRTLDVYIRRLRVKLGSKRAPLIESVHGFGYKFRGTPVVAKPAPKAADRWQKLQQGAWTGLEQVRVVA